MAENLEERLKKINKDSLKEALLAPKILPREKMSRIGYFKYNITDNLEIYLNRKGVVLFEKPKSSVGGNLYSTIRKEPLKQVQYGMINCENIGGDVFSALTDWEAIYFMTGVWNKKTTLSESLRYSSELLERQPVELIVAETVASGIYRLKKIHEKQGYETEPELPYAKEILERYYALRSKFMKQTHTNNSDSEQVNNKEKKPEQLKLF
jgi:hypothetical protein